MIIEDMQDETKEYKSIKTISKTDNESSIDVEEESFSNESSIKIIDAKNASIQSEDNSLDGSEKLGDYLMQFKNMCKQT